MFSQFVGKLQPILSQLPKRLGDITYVSRDQQRSERDRLLEELQDQADELEKAGFDLDQITESDLEEPERLNPPYSLAFSSNAPWNCGIPKYAVDNSILISITNLTTLPTYAAASISGTANCKGLVQNDLIKVRFIAINYESIREEIVSGKGDNLEALSVMYGCENEIFKNFFKSKYSLIYDDDSNNPIKVLNRLNHQIHKSENLKYKCDLLS